RRKRPLVAALALAFPVGIATMVLGFLAFLPFHGLKALNVSDGLIVAALLALALVVTLRAKRIANGIGIGIRNGIGNGHGLGLGLGVWYGWHAVVAGALALRGALDGGRLATIAAAVAVGVGFHLAARRLAPVEVGSASAAE